MNTALDQFAIPGDASFPLNQAFEAPKDRQDAETLRQYVFHKRHLHEVLGLRCTGICHR